jgi:hypothetical protein
MSVSDEISGGPDRPRNRVVAWATLALLGAVALSGGAYAATRGGAVGCGHRLAEPLVVRLAQ